MVEEFDRLCPPLELIPTAVIRSEVNRRLAAKHQGGPRMNYDDWKLESPEDEDERLNGPIRRRQARLEYLADQRDEFLEAEQMEKNNDGNA
jgi:hypothetical protein